MQRDLTKRYQLLFKKNSGKNPVNFIFDLYRYGKLREFGSFIVWEVLHRLRLFPKADYLIFNNPEAITLDHEDLTGEDFHQKVEEFFQSRGLRATKCEINWKLLYTDARGQIFGSVYPHDKELSRSVDGGNAAQLLHRFPESIKSIFVSSQGTIFVGVRGSVYRSCDDGLSFEKCLELGSPESFFRFDNEMTETPQGLLVIGEYGNMWEKSGWRKLAYLYYSSDNGATWTTSDYFNQKGANKHVHIIKFSKRLNRLVAADGDNYKRLWISGPLDTFDPQNPSWNLVNRFHIQMGGHTSMVETDEKIFFGTDYQGGTNFLIETADGKQFTKRIVPDPYRRSPIDNMRQRKAVNGAEIWANLPFSISKTKCLLMYTADHGASWHKVFDYQRKNHSVWLISSSSGITDTLYFSIEDLKTNTRAVYKVADQD